MILISAGANAFEFLGCGIELDLPTLQVRSLLRQHGVKRKDRSRSEICTLLPVRFPARCLTTAPIPSRSA
jgi:hypothetical protein